jgi:hypothetical protein
MATPSDPNKSNRMMMGLLVVLGIVVAIYVWYRQTGQ